MTALCIRDLQKCFCETNFGPPHITFSWYCSQWRIPTENEWLQEIWKNHRKKKMREKPHRNISRSFSKWINKEIHVIWTHDRYWITTISFSIALCIHLFFYFLLVLLLCDEWNGLMSNYHTTWYSSTRPDHNENETKRRVSSHHS